MSVEAKEGDTILDGREMLTQQGADELNVHRMRIERGETPTVLESMAYAIYHEPVNMHMELVYQLRQRADAIGVSFLLLQLNARDVAIHYPGRLLPEATEEGFAWIKERIDRKREREKRKR